MEETKLNYTPKYTKEEINELFSKSTKVKDGNFSKEAINLWGFTENTLEKQRKIDSENLQDIKHTNKLKRCLLNFFSKILGNKKA